MTDLDRTIPFAKLTRSGQIDCEIFKHHLQMDHLAGQNTRPFETDPRLQRLRHRQRLSAADAIDRAGPGQPAQLRRTHEADSAILATARANLTNPPRVLVETAIRQNRGAIAFYESGIYELAGQTPQLSSLREPAQVVVRTLREHQTFLEKELLPRATGDWRLGKEKFAQKLKFELNSGIDADEVLKEAEAEAQRVELEMFVIARQLWPQVFPGKVMPQDDDAGRRAAIKLVLEKISTEHGTTEDLVKDATATVARIKAFIRERDILRLPEPDQCKIIEMPEFQRGNSMAYLNPAPPLDAKAASYYAISPPPRDWDAGARPASCEEYNRYMLQILTIHEAYPGHYVQLAYANSNHSLIRKVLYSGVFAEGWAVYTEQMMLDEGFGHGDLKLRLNQLKWYLRTVCNAILDYRMHCTNMTDEEAIAFLMLRGFQSEAEAILKIIRSKQSSCQLSTYFVGRTAFQRLRRQVQSRTGRALRTGPIPRSVSGSRHPAGEVSGGTGSGAAEKAKVRLDFYR